MAETINYILEAVCADWDVGMEELLGRRRDMFTFGARQEAYLRLRRLRLSYKDIGKVMNRHHSSVLRACRDPSRGLKVRSEVAAR